MDVVFNVTEHKNYDIDKQGANSLPRPLLSQSAATVLNWILLTLLCQAIDVFGVATNIVNIVCFVKQGFKDPVNVSLLGLAVSDLGCLTTLIWTDICYTPAFVAADLPFNSIELNYLTSGIPHVTFTRITGWITALITLERCLCIAAPIKVKTIVTSKRVAIIIIGIFLVLISFVAPVYVVNRLGLKFVPAKNKTIIGLVFTNDRENVERISFIINNVFIPFSGFIIITISTITLAVKLKKIATWRKTSITSGQADNVTNRNQKVAKMVVIISTLFIACFIPANIVFIAMSIEPQLAVDGKYVSLLVVAGSFGLVLESINSSGNIFVYYYMSSKYREVFHQVFSNICRKSNCSISKNGIK